MTKDIQTQITVMADAVAHLRKTLEANDIDGLAEALSRTQFALDQVNAYPGGTDQLKKDLDVLQSPLKEEVLARLEQATVDHHINGELIRLAIQKNAALQAYIAQQSDSATYSSKGGVPGIGSGVFSRKI